MFIIDKISSLSPRSKEALYKIVFNILAVIFFFLLLFSIFKTERLSYIHITPSSDTSFIDEPVSDVSNFNSNSIYINNSINSVINELFSTRNNAFLNGNVENLYNFYNKDNKNSKYSLKYEFKRIACIRDWLIQRNIILTSVNSNINIKDIKVNGNKLSLKVDEKCKFTYIYPDNTMQNEFEVDLIHIISLDTTDDSYTVDKDYYLDFLGDETNSYNFTLNETSLPYTNSIDNNFKINKDFKSGDILSYYKFNFVDHRAIVSGYDSNGYPLINSTTISCSNLPYDLGWKTKNIKID